MKSIPPIKYVFIKSDPTLKVFQLSDVFAEDRTYLGFGRPNVYFKADAI